MKKLNKICLILLAIFLLVSCVEEFKDGENNLLPINSLQTTQPSENTYKGEAEIIKQFDLHDQKCESWVGTIDSEFYADRIVFIMKKTSTYPELKITQFRFLNGKSVEYSSLAPNDNMLTDEEYLSGFRQMGVIYLKQQGKEKVLEGIEYLNTLEFIKYAGPEMIFTGGDD